MTRQRFEGLRREMVRRIIAQSIARDGKVQHTMDGKEIELKLGRCLKMDRVKWEGNSCKSYSEVWEAMKPARDLVGM